MHYYPHHIGDYQRDTSALSVIEHGAYRLLMDAYYVSEQPLPADLSTLCRICRAFSKAEREAVATVIVRFFHEENGVLRHKRIEAEIQHFQKVSTVRSRNGKLGGRPPGKLAESKEKPKALPTESKTKANSKPSSTQEPVPITQEPALELRESQQLSNDGGVSSPRQSDRHAARMRRTLLERLRGRRFDQSDRNLRRAVNSHFRKPRLA